MKASRWSLARTEPRGDHLEIGIVDGESAPVIVHAMKAREKYLR